MLGCLPFFVVVCYARLLGYLFACASLPFVYLSCLFVKLFVCALVFYCVAWVFRLYVSYLFCVCVCAGLWVRLLAHACLVVCLSVCVLFCFHRFALLRCVCLSDGFILGLTVVVCLFARSLVRFFNLFLSVWLRVLLFVLFVCLFVRCCLCVCLSGIVCVFVFCLCICFCGFIVFGRV